jgi:hypothetical protein
MKSADLKHPKAHWSSSQSVGRAENMSCKRYPVVYAYSLLSEQDCSPISSSFDEKPLGWMLALELVPQGDRIAP